MSLDFLLNSYLNPIWGRRIGYMAICLAALLLFISLIKGLLWVGDIHSSDKNKQPGNLTLFAANAVQPLPNIALWHLFGLHSVVPKQLNLLPNSNLLLTLNGILTDDNSQQSEALISTANQPIKIYKIGDTLPGGAKVYEILADSVVIEHDGKFEKVLLPVQPIIFSNLPPNLHFESAH